MNWATYGLTLWESLALELHRSFALYILSIEIKRENHDRGRPDNVSNLQISEIDLRQIAREIWNRRVIFLSVTAGFVLITSLILHIIPVQYTVSLSVAPVADSNTQIGGGGLSALAKLGGVDLSNIAGGSGQFGLFVAALTSREAADAVAQDSHLMRGLFPEQWSETKKTWIEPAGFVHFAARNLKLLFGIPVEPWHQPNGEQVYDILTRNLQIDDDPKNPIVTISIQSKDSEVARELLVKLTSSIDSILRQRAMRRANDYINYLSRELDKATVAEYRTALIQHVFDQEQTRMMASANVSFAAQVFSGPSRSAKPTAPKSALLLVFFAIVGAFVGGGAAVIVDRRKRNG